MKKLHIFFAALSLAVASIPAAHAHDSFSFGFNVGSPYVFQPYQPPVVTYYPNPPVYYYGAPPVIQYQSVPTYIYPQPGVRYWNGGGRGWGHGWRGDDHRGRHGWRDRDDD